MIRSLAAAAALAATAGLCAVLATPLAAQQTEWGDVRVRCSATDGDLFQINVLVLVDASNSLSDTDPQLRRVHGVRRTVDTLADLQARQRGHVSVAVAVDTFSQDYYRHLGWDTPENIAELLDLPGVRAGIAERVSWTDYTAALSGAEIRFSGAPDSRCNLLVWFTDGEHDTETPGELVPAETAALERLCNVDAAMENLSHELGVTTLAVMLSDPARPADPATLEMLFGVDDRCQNPLAGRIQTFEQAGELGEQLDEIAAEAVTDNVCTSPLPGETQQCGDVPPPAAADDCLPDTSTQECVYEFTIDAAVEAFRLHIDQTALNRGIARPQEIAFVMVSPSGQASAAVRHYELTDSTDDGWQQIPPFGFWAFKPYDSRWQIIGHRSAVEADDWAGTWQLRFWGDTEAGRRDAQKVAAAIRTVRAAEPQVIDAEVAADGALVGYLHQPRFGQPVVPYTSAELFLAPSDENGERYYLARSGNTGYLAPDPLLLDSNDGSFKVPDIGEVLLSWDSEHDPRAMNDGCEVAGGGKIYDALNAGGRVEAVTMLERAFVYGPPDNLQVWTTPNTAVDVTTAVAAAISRQETQLQARAENCRALRRAAAARGRVVEWLGTQPDPLPGSVTAQTIRRATTGTDSDPHEAVVAISVTGGALPWTATLETVLIEPGPIPEPIAEDQRPFTVPAIADAEIQRWSCVSSSPAEPQGWINTPGERTDCPPLRLRVEPPATFTVTVMVQAVADTERLQEHLNAIDWDQETPADARRWMRQLLDTAAAGRSLAADAGGYTVTVPGPRPDILWLLLAALGVFAATMRVVRAARVRRWEPLTLPDYVVVRLDTDEKPETSVAPDLVKAACSADLLHAKIRSGWTRPLMGRGRRITVSAAGLCCGAVTTRTRRGRSRAVLGGSLQDGWCAVRGPDGDWLLVWDLPPEDVRQQWLSTLEALARQARAALAAAARTKGDTAAPDDDAGGDADRGDDPLETKEKH